MARKNQNWDELGQSIQNIVDRAVNQQDYASLSQDIRQTLDRAVDMGTEAIRRAASRNSSREQQQGRQTAAPPSQDLSVLYGKTGKLTTAGILKIVGGGLVSCVTLISLVAGLILAFVDGQLVPTVLSLTGMAGGAGLITSGTRTLNRVSRFKTYRKTLGSKTWCTLEKLARSVGKSEKFVRKEVTGMIDQGLFPEGHLDKEQTRLITSEETYRQFEQSRLQLEERLRLEAAQMAQRETAVQSPQVREVLEKGDAFLARIRSCNDAIPGVEISEKISRMERIIQRIFRRAETNPEVVPDLKKLMNYYLPMTVKLLDAYADMDAQPVQGDTITNAKKEIEETLDTLNLAFEKLLDALFQDTALDVSSDISVLQTLLAQEGLVDDGLKQSGH